MTPSTEEQVLISLIAFHEDRATYYRDLATDQRIRGNSDQALIYADHAQQSEATVAALRRLQAFERAEEENKQRMKAADKYILENQ